MSAMAQIFSAVTASPYVSSHIRLYVKFLLHPRTEQSWRSNECRFCIPCGGCNKVYVGETKRSVGERIKEHNAKIANNLSAVAEHHQNTGHEADLENIKVLYREDKLLPRKVREAIFIKKEASPTLNRDGGMNFQKSTIHF